jgi:hypothetical protein
VRTPSPTPLGYHAPHSAPQHSGTSVVTMTLLLTAPAVLGAAACRPKGKSGATGGRRGH